MLFSFFFFIQSNEDRNIKKSRDVNGIPYINNPIYPDIPETEDDVYIITSDTDRYDLLASRFYGDSSLWWIIPAANKTTSRDTIYPTNKESIRNFIEYYKELGFEKGFVFIDTLLSVLCV